MGIEESLNLYEGLIQYFLPEGVLNFFELTAFCESTRDIDSPYNKRLELYLDERDNRTEDMTDLKPNGFTEPKHILDYPIRGRETVLHIRRRRWLDKDGKSFVIPLEKTMKIVYPQTRYSEEFATFLKVADGQ